MTDQELIAAVASEENDDVYQSLIDEYGQEYLQEEQPDDQVLTLDDEGIKIACGDDALNIVQRAFYGGRYRFEQDSFNPNDEYFYMNGYGNMISLQESDLHEYLEETIDSKDDFIEWCVKEGYVSADDLNTEA
ncbi:MAG: hypothetical protein IKT27_06190 [Clostridia bacterium]|nr:hypothetical protein [Clostridia bacterium]